MSFAMRFSASTDCLLQRSLADRCPITAAAKRSHRRRTPRQLLAAVHSRSPVEAAACDSLRVLRDLRHSTRHRTACGAVSGEVEEAQELDERDGTGGADFQMSEELLAAIRPETVPTPILEAEEVWSLLDSTVHDRAREHYKAFFSSTLGGIVVDPALMTVSIDDHMVHRGHAVFDTAKLVDGHLYQLLPHVDRLLMSAGRAAIAPPMSIEQMVRTILETAAVSCVANGPGGFGLSPTECVTSTFYCIVYTDEGQRLDITKGWTVKTSPVPSKAPYFATLKSTNYLSNALNLLDAEVEDFDQGIFVDADGNVAEGPNMNLGILTHEGVIVTPLFEHALPGITMSRLIELVPEFMEKGLLNGVNGVEQRPISLEEAKGAKEVFLTSSSLPVMPVTHWDGKPVANGEVGAVAVLLHTMMDRDATPSDGPKDGSGPHLPVPYGYVTGMDEPEDV